MYALAVVSRAGAGVCAHHLCWRSAPHVPARCSAHHTQVHAHPVRVDPLGHGGGLVNRVLVRRGLWHGAGPQPDGQARHHAAQSLPDCGQEARTALLRLVVYCTLRR